MVSRSSLGNRLAGLALMLALCGAAPGYFHYLHYRNVDGQMVAMPEKFDLRALPSNTVQYFLSLDGLETLADGDSLQSVVSEINAAASVWNSVDTSQLRLQFGGFRDINAPQSTPSIDIVFEEMPPGLIALGGPTVRTEVVEGPQGPFVPVQRAVVKFSKDLSQQPSYGEQFFLTAVHEIGHTLGLQHTLTSSVMSTQITRATSKAHPIDTDDQVGVSLLYPAANFPRRQATISGRVTLNGEGVHLASVVAIGTVRSPVSTLTLPDGTYQLQGLPPGYYYIYVHPLPPPVYGEVSPANVVFPLDENGDPVPPGPNFALQFYGSSTNVVNLHEGDVLDNVNFEVTPRDSEPVHSVQTYSFYSREPIKGGFFNRTVGYGFLLATGAGLMNNGHVTDGLKLRVLNGGDSVLDYTVGPYPPAPDFLQTYILPYPLGGNGGRHLMISVPGDSYVLPDAFRLVSNQPPVVTSVTLDPPGEGQPTATVTGTNLNASTRILFDGANAQVLSVGDGTMSVRVPPAVSGHAARVVALNSDRQSSLFIQGADAPVVQYGDRPPSSLSITPATLETGTEQLVEIDGVNTDFVQGAVSVGFSSSDIFVERSWVTSTGTLMANVSVSPFAQPGQYSLTVLSGLNLVSLPLGVSVENGQEGAPALSSQMLNEDSGQPILYAGARVRIPARNLDTADPTNLSITVGGLAATIEEIQPDSILIRLPDELPQGPAVLAARLGDTDLPPLSVQIDRQPPVIASIRHSDGTPLDADHPALKNSFILIQAANLVPVVPGDDAPVLDVSRFRISFGDDSEKASQVVPIDAQPGVYAVNVPISSFVATGDAVPVTLWFDGQPSLPVKISIVERPAGSELPEWWW